MMELHDWANMGEVCAWLVEDREARARFAAWHRAIGERLGNPQPLDDGGLVLWASSMFTHATDLVVEITS